MKTKSKGFKIAMIVLACLAVFGLGYLTYYLTFSSQRKPKEFDTGYGVTITLTNQFKEDEYPDHYSLLSSQIGFIATQYTFTELLEYGYQASTITREQFAQAMILSNNFESSVQVDDENNLVYYDYIDYNNGDYYFNRCFVYRLEDSIVECEFYCFNKKANSYKERFNEFAKTAVYEEGQPATITVEQFTSAIGVSITLTNEFIKDEDSATSLSVLGNSGASFYVEKVSFTEFATKLADISDKNEEEILTILATNNDTSIIKDNANNLMYFEYTENYNGKNYHFRTSVIKGSEHVYICEFSCNTKLKTQLNPKFTEWAKTVTLNED